MSWSIPEGRGLHVQYESTSHTQLMLNFSLPGRVSLNPRELRAAQSIHSQVKHLVFSPTYRILLFTIQYGYLQELSVHWLIKLIIKFTLRDLTHPLLHP